MNKIVKTSDGSHTIYVPELDEHYHSIHGAIQESNHIFINSGFDACKAEPVRILEIGFGTGLNAFLTYLRAEAMKRTVYYTAIEKFPLSIETAMELNYHEFTGQKSREILLKLHEAEWNRKIMLSDFFTIEKLSNDFTSLKLNGKYDLVYFDAFGPDKQPEMWTGEMFLKISEATVSGGILVTYSAKGEVKRHLRAGNYNVELLPGPPGKRQITRAVKI